MEIEVVRAERYAGAEEDSRKRFNNSAKRIRARALHGCESSAHTVSTAHLCLYVFVSVLAQHSDIVPERGEGVSRPMVHRD